ncbi:NUDIX domain-containing protein [Brucella pseudintermedia]|uniref:NUDIX domain-containing protein n=1 Tax=Brucella pseudintermedia TaxID=370111 RepID=UPI00366F59DA|nr:NUDIX domain-containing protein [Brucella pseudintermedia]
MDQPIAHTADGRPLFDNTPTVVCLLVPDKSNKKLLIVRRANEPGKGLLGLPGGYHMRGESWQQAGAREVAEETGYYVDPRRVSLFSFKTDEYGNNLVIAFTDPPETSLPEQLDRTEVEEVLWIDNPLKAEDWAFPRHFAAVEQYFALQKQAWRL